MNKIFAPFLPPWAETGLQPAFYDVESGTVLQQTARMYAKVQQLTRLFNELSEETRETVEEYIAKFVELKDFVDNYFDNLDVQEEINNKLDDMAEQGVLADIISEYLNSIAVFGYNTVADMQGATNLVEGSFARTLGYYAAKDGGGALYQIKSSVTSDDIYVVIGDDLYAVLAEISPSANQFGCYGDGTHNDQTALQNYIDYIEAHNKVAKLNAGCTYSVSSILISSKIKLYGNGATLKAQGSSSVLRVEITQDAETVFVTDLTIDGNDTAEVGLDVIQCRNFEFASSEIINIVNYGIKIVAGYELYAHNIRISNATANTSSTGIYARTSDCVFEDIVIKDFKIGVDVRSNSNRFVRIHGWNILPEIVKGSIFFQIDAGCCIEECYNDTYQYGFKVQTPGRSVILRDCENQPGPTYINSTVLEGGDIYVFYFDNGANYSKYIDNNGMYTIKQAGIDCGFYYSNIDKTEWQNNQNAVSNNPQTARALGVDNMPIGSYYTLSSVDNTKWTMGTQTIIVSDNTVYMNIVAKFIGTTTTNHDESLGFLPEVCRFGAALESYCPILNTRYNSPVSLGALYLNQNNGNIAVKFPDGDTATNQFVMIERTYPRCKTN